MPSRSILWLVDVPGWAYDRRAKMLSVHLPGYQHRILYNIVAALRGVSAAVAAAALADADIIVCPDPRILPLLEGCVVLSLNAVKVFD